MSGTALSPHVANPYALIEGAEFGAAMRALPNDRWRAFVCALFEVKPGKGLWVRAFKMAGFGVLGKTTPQTYSANASRMAHDEPFRRRFGRSSRGDFVALGPAAFSALTAVLGNPQHRDHVRAIALVLDRTNPVEQIHHVKSEQRHVIVDEDKVLARIRELAAIAGLDYREMPSMIDVTPPAIEDKIQDGNRDPDDQQTA